MNMWDNPTFERLRDSRRRKSRSGRVAFDCFNLKVADDRAYCAKGHSLGQSEDRTFPLRSVLMGITPGICRKCQDFDGGE